MIMNQSPKHDDFTPHVNKDFRFEGRPQALRLAAIDTAESPNQPQDQRKPFTLIFQGVKGEVMPEGLYTAEADGGARFELYVMPIHTPAPDRQDYQAVFN
jgi:hypothetical protein